MYIYIIYACLSRVELDIILIHLGTFLYFYLLASMRLFFILIFFYDKLNYM